MNKNRSLALLCAVIPGAGHMYMDMMQKGLTIMIAFFAVASISGFTGLHLLNFLMPVIWFYAFFDVVNVRDLPYEWRMGKDHEFMNRVWGTMKQDPKNFMGQHQHTIGIVCIVVGSYVILRMALSPLLSFVGSFSPMLYNMMHSMIWDLPNLVVAVGIIYLGFKLVKKHHEDQPTTPQ